MRPLWSSPRLAQVRYSTPCFIAAKGWFFQHWCDWASERGQPLPADLSGACKYGSLFMQAVFGGSIQGHYEHQYNLIDGQVVDLSHDALDVGRMRQPYRHEPTYFDVPEVQASLGRCQPRADDWARAFVAQCGHRPSPCAQPG